MDYKKREKEIKEWFKDHVAQYSIFKNESGVEIESLVWGKPETNCCRIRYLRVGGLVIIAGDLGEAIHQWYPGCVLEGISKCSLSYFAEKCQASNNGRNPTVWDSDEAVRFLREHFETYNFSEILEDQYPEEANKEEVELLKHCFWESGFDGQDQFKLEGAYISWHAAKEDGMLGATENEYEWQKWLENYGEKYLGQDFWEWAYSVGSVVSTRCQSHLVGLRMAFEQLGKN